MVGHPQHDCEQALKAASFLKKHGGGVQAGAYAAKALRGAQHAIRGAGVR